MQAIGPDRSHEKSRGWNAYSVVLAPRNGYVTTRKVHGIRSVTPARATPAVGATPMASFAMRTSWPSRRSSIAMFKTASTGVKRRRGLMATAQNKLRKETMRRQSVGAYWSLRHLNSSAYQLTVMRS